MWEYLLSRHNRKWRSLYGFDWVQAEFLLHAHTHTNQNPQQAMWLLNILLIFICIFNFNMQQQRRQRWRRLRKNMIKNQKFPWADWENNGCCMFDESRFAWFKRFLVLSFFLLILKAKKDGCSINPVIGRWFSIKWLSAAHWSRHMPFMRNNWTSRSNSSTKPVVKHEKKIKQNIWI